jgi:hypothetical protein
MPKPPPRFTSGGRAPASSASRAAAAGLDHRSGGQRLRSGEDMEAAPFRAGVDHAPHQRRRPARVHAEGRGAPPHLHPRSTQLEIGIDSHREPRRHAQPRADRERALGLGLRFEIERHARAQRRLQLEIALAGAGEADVGRRHGVTRPRQLARRGNVHPVHQRRDAGEQRRERIGLDGIMDADTGGQRRAQPGDARLHHRKVIDIGGGPDIRPWKLAQRGEFRRDRAMRFCGDGHLSPKLALSAVRSSLPLALRGSAARQS